MLTTQLHLAPRLRMTGAIPLSPYTPSWRAQGQLHLSTLTFCTRRDTFCKLWLLFSSDNVISRQAFNRHRNDVARLMYDVTSGVSLQCLLLPTDALRTSRNSQICANSSVTTWNVAQAACSLKHGYKWRAFGKQMDRKNAGTCCIIQLLENEDVDGS